MIPIHNDLWDVSHYLFNINRCMCIWVYGGDIGLDWSGGGSSYPALDQFT